MKKLFALLIAIILALPSFALAETGTLELTGIVTATQSESIISPVSGSVSSYPVMAGSHVNAGDPLVTLNTVKYYAEQDGVIRTFGAPGDSAAAVVQRYGGVAYLEPALRYTISASTKNASSSSDENKIIHAGETVYLRAYDNYNLKGTGVVTIVSGSNYTIEVNSANFVNGQTINVYRNADYATTTLLGRGTIALTEAVVYSGSGYLVRWHVSDGQQVSTGDLLFECIEGEFAPGSTEIDCIRAERSGVITAVNTAKGKTVAVGDSIFDFYPDEGLRVKALVMESDLESIEIGAEVQVRLPSQSDTPVVLTGRVESISLLPEESTTTSTGYETSYPVYILMDTTEGLRYGMTVTVSVP